MASNGSCSVATWIIFKDHLMEVGLVLHFFILEVGGGIMKRRKIEYFKMLLCLLIENHRRHQTVRSFMANHCQKYSPLLRLVLQALLHPSIDPRMKTLRMQTTIHNLSGVPCGAFCIPTFLVCVATLKAQTLTFSLNVLMLMVIWNNWRS